ncbi:MAG: sigma-70 family RNA polymerase sigma factor [Bdellovibrionales bacterium]|nr:sigma-70 family RNA polymerase sigma factor [Bdellovibrionales bacterium]
MSSSSFSSGQNAVAANVVTDVSPEQSVDPEHWLEAHGNYLFRYAFSRVNSRELAEELVQETLLSAIRGVSGFEGRSTVRTWLVGILKNKIIDHLRRASRKESKEVLTDEDDVLDRQFNRLGIWSTIFGDWARDPDQVLEQKEFFRTLEGCLRKIPERSQRAFMLKTFENTDSDEICKILNISASNLWVSLHRCRLALRECLDKNWVKAGGRS